MRQTYFLLMQLMMVVLCVFPGSLLGQKGIQITQEQLMQYKWYPDIYEEDEGEFSFWTYSRTQEIDTVYYNDGALEVYSVRYYLSDKADTTFDESKVGKVSKGYFVITESAYKTIPALAYEILELTDEKMVIRHVTPGMSSYMSKMILYAIPKNAKNAPLHKSAWSLKLDLVNPTGKLDNQSYFMATLKNESDTIYYIVMRRPSEHSVLWAIYDTANDTCQFRRECFFDFNIKSVYTIKPHEELKIRLHLSISPVEFLNGVLPYNSELTRKIKRVRIMVKDLYFLPQSATLSWTINQGLQHADVYSNWLEIDGEEFYRIFRGKSMSD